MQKALCNASAEQEGHMHICHLGHGHQGKTHSCKCGALFISAKQISVKKAEPEEPEIFVAPLSRSSRQSGTRVPSE